MDQGEQGKQVKVRSTPCWIGRDGVAQGGAPVCTVPCLRLGDGCHSEVLEKEVREHGSEERDIRYQEPE